MNILSFYTVTSIVCVVCVLAVFHYTSVSQCVCKCMSGMSERCGCRHEVIKNRVTNA